MTRIFSFEDLPTADLVVDAIYEGGSARNTGSDPIARLLPGAGNQGGFRASGLGSQKKFVVLYSSGEEGTGPTDWISIRVSSCTTVTTARRAMTFMTPRVAAISS